MTWVFPAFSRFFVMIFGDTFNSHKAFLDRLTMSQRHYEVFSVDESDVIFAFLPVVSRTGTDIAAALQKIPQHKPVVLVVLHHTYDPYYIAPDSRYNVKSDRMFAVDCLFYEGSGLLNCLRNDEAIKAVKKHLHSQEPTENTSCDVRTMREHRGIDRKGIYAVAVILLLIIMFILIGVFS